MAILVGNDTYVRLVFDPDETEPVFKIDGKIVDAEKVGDLIAEGGTLDLSQNIKEDAVPIRVTFRPLRAADKTAIEDTIQMEYGGSTGRMAPGTMRRLAIKRAVVSWDYEVPWSEAIMDNLDPNIFEQIYGWVSWGSEPAKQDEETGLPLDETPPPPNRGERRAAARSSSAKTTKKTPKIAAVPESVS